ncbi:MAG: SgcJ/EcaC family oxidoreductase [Bradyrhizobium sp.]|uniref:SgcJ/EcaC family oxidoreductase n=1 Tax=Bradyrhizobium sp. TaxID=376 RepID=UPI001203F121|nr:SgcJ/EcaC family oxidoreductase [Bradyrhizobium sp.]THD48820.1 MAG: SgcJ/EcaC family oxidoreductase [Bradyrhizobium sp.]
MNLARVLSVSLLLVASGAIAGPAEDANRLVDRWSATYSSNDRDALVKLYTSDAILLGTVSPVISEGTEAITKYFGPLTGNTNAIGERRTIVLGDNAVLVTGFYEFTRMKDGQPVPGPSRFTMLLTKRDGEWRIAHHHSSPHVQPK